MSVLQHQRTPEADAGWPPVAGDESVESRLRRVIALHFHPVDGSAYWLKRAREMAFDPVREIQRLEDLELLGETTIADLQSRPLTDFVPRRLLRRMDRLRICQTGGTTGSGGFGTWAAYREDELLEAFVLPFVAAARHVAFPSREPWLFIGPSGPHVIGKVARHLAAALGSGEPFSVDFDPRWARRLAEGSFARQRYLGHVIEQAMAVLTTQDVGVLFSTPPVLEALAAALTPKQRERIRGVHHGGLAIAPERMERFQTELFPAAVHLSGYGNTLLGCCLELNSALGRQLDYFPWGNRLVFETVDEDGSSVPPGGLGQVRVTRLDESMLIVRLRERDFAELLPPPGGLEGSEFRLPGLRNPGPRAADAPAVSAGLY